MDSGLTSPAEPKGHRVMEQKLKYTYALNGRLDDVSDWPEDGPVREHRIAEVVETLFTHHLKGERIEVAKLAHLKGEMSRLIETAYQFTAKAA